MDAVEGKRAQPRPRPPFPAAFGVWGYPTTINNVKTLSYTPEIIRRGAKWFSSIGVNKSTGTAIACINGNIRYPGMYEVPMGVTLGHLVNDIGGGIPDGKKLKMLQTGGPLVEFLALIVLRYILILMKCERLEQFLDLEELLLRTMKHVQ